MWPEQRALCVVRASGRERRKGEGKGRETEKSQHGSGISVVFSVVFYFMLCHL